MKKCSKCKSHKPIIQFTKDHQKSSGVSSWCVDCGSKSRKAYYKSNRSTIIKSTRSYQKADPERTNQRASNFRSNNKTSTKRARVRYYYKISLEEYNEKLAHRFCDICKKDKGELVLDHNHASGSIRGALCRECNVGLGLFKDDPAFLVSAIEYLKRYE